MSSAPSGQRKHRNADGQIWRKKRKAVFSSDISERQEPEGFHGPAVIPGMVTGTSEKIAPVTGLSTPGSSTVLRMRNMRSLPARSYAGERLARVSSQLFRRAFASTGANDLPQP